jgi:hypothetical protein
LAPVSGAAVPGAGDNGGLEAAEGNQRPASDGLIAKKKGADFKKKPRDGHAAADAVSASIETEGIRT